MDDEKNINQFRFWHDNFMHYHDERGILTRSDMSGGDDFSWYMFSGHSIVMQWTGLYDKTGRKIWQGDVVEVTRRCAFIYDDYVTKGVVKFGEHQVGFDSDMGSTGPAWGWYLEAIEEPRNSYDTPIGKSMIGEYVSLTKSSQLEVVGDIYQNPELIKSHE